MKKFTIKCLNVLLNAIAWISPRVAGWLLFRIFTKPPKRAKIQHRERAMMRQAERKTFIINGKKVISYYWGDGKNPVLYMHGWKSRGSRMANYAEQLLQLGYSPITFDAPGHGDSEGYITNLLEYELIAKILYQQHGGFKAIIAHSYGVLAAFYSVRNGVPAERIIAIGGVGDFNYLVDQYAKIAKLSTLLKQLLIERVEEYFEPLDDIWQRFSVAYQKEKIDSKILLIHDRKDKVVNIEQARKIKKYYGQQAQLIETQTLGHNRIVFHPQVLQQVIGFIDHDDWQVQTTIVGNTRSDVE